MYLCGMVGVDLILTCELWIMYPASGEENSISILIKGSQFINYQLDT